MAPEPLDVNQSSPSPDTLFRILAAVWCSLAHDLSLDLSSTYTLIKDNWPTISSWIISLMNQVHLSDVQDTRDGYDTIQRTYWILPLFLQLKPFNTALRNARNETSLKLEKIIGRIWLDAIERKHPSWGQWSQVLVFILMKEDLNHYTDILADVPLQTTLFVRHLNRLAHEVPTMNDLEEIEHLFGLLPDPRLWGRNKTPFGSDTTMDGRVGAFTHLLSSILRRSRGLQKPASMKRHEVAGEVQRIRNIAFQILHYFRVIVAGRYMILEALEAGIIPALIKANPEFFDVECGPAEMRGKIDDSAVQFLRRLSEYLIYPEILSEVLRCVRSISVDCQNALTEKSNSVAVAWEELTQKAFGFGAIRRGLKAQGTYPPRSNGIVWSPPVQRVLRCCLLFSALSKGQLEEATSNTMSPASSGQEV
ncbi:hypothetical protein PM082_004223 [Marasmius tenuissimus]|nr:hypothetical protein PM082_004223 [Marasmius tenuissimus]